MSSVAVDKFGVVGKNVWKWISLLCNNLSIVSLCWNFGSLVHSPQTMFQLLIMTFFSLSTRNPAKSSVKLGSWVQISDTNCILQTLLDVRDTVFSTTTSTTSRWCRDPYSLTQVYAAIIQNMQLFISSSFNRKKVQGFTILLYSFLWVTICNFSTFVCKCAAYIIILTNFIHSKYIFQAITQSFQIALSHISIRCRKKYPRTP